MLFFSQQIVCDGLSSSLHTRDARVYSYVYTCTRVHRRRRIRTTDACVRVSVWRARGKVIGPTKGAAASCRRYNDVHECTCIDILRGALRRCYKITAEQIEHILYTLLRACAREYTYTHGIDCFSGRFFCFFFTILLFSAFPRLGSRQAKRFEEFNLNRRRRRGFWEIHTRRGLFRRSIAGQIQYDVMYIYIYISYTL